VEASQLNSLPAKKNSNFSTEMIEGCLLVMESGDIDELFEIIPRIGVLRDRRFHEPLIGLLSQKDVKRREFAAYAMGAMGDAVFLDPLKKAFLSAQKMRGFGAEEFQIAVIEAIGSIGDDAVVDFFLPIIKNAEASKGKSKMHRWIVESLGAIAQQGGERSLSALVELTYHSESDLQMQAISELAVAYWHRPNEIADGTLVRIHELTGDANEIVAESAVAALQSLADVGCVKAEMLFPNPDE
jgi:HEAT repeat protein